MACRPLVGPVRRAAARRDRPIVATHPWGCHRPPDRRSDRVRQADPGAAVRLLLRGDRRHHLLGDHDPRPPRRMDRARGVRPAQARSPCESYDRIVGLVLDDIAVDGCITKAPGGGEVAGPSPVDRGKQGMKRSALVEGYGIPLGRVLAGANRHDSPLLAPTLDQLDELGPLPEEITVHLDAGYDSRQDPRHPRRARPARARSRTRARRRRSRPASGGMSSAPTPGTTRSTGSNAATNAARRSSTRSSTSPTRSSPCVA